MSRLFYFFVKIFCRKEMKDMVVIYATLIIKGLKTIADVPAIIREKVKQTLIDLDCADLAE